MANTKISALTALTGANLATDDAFAVVDTSATATKKITVAEMKLGIMPAPGPIGGTTPSTGAFTTLSATTGAAVGGATAGTGGLAFPATAVAVADANTLDDYEEGTFTPTITAITGSFTTIINQVGKYTKIGNVVNVYISFAISSIGTATTGFNAGNLQFANVAAVNSPVSGVNVSTDVPFGGYVAAGGTSIRCFATLTTTNTYNVMATYFTS